MKNKTKKAAKKRFKLTSTGKILRKGGLSSHLKEHKSARRLRSQLEPKLVAGPDKKKIKRLLNQ
ncbi:MAG TPA: 50S ribosomal protein L35 [Candidatus Saccharimonadales bacterium]|nr:50S ribosomal protein L35 [Candidatus Saccharimonadales bacterium]